MLQRQVTQALGINHAYQGLIAACILSGTTKCVVQHATACASLIKQLQHAPSPHLESIYPSPHIRCNIDELYKKFSFAQICSSRNIKRASCPDSFSEQNFQTLSSLIRWGLNLPLHAYNQHSGVRLRLNPEPNAGNLLLQTQVAGHSRTSDYTNAASANRHKDIGRTPISHS
jgi:hypothetical protein